jgi:hypothetical protein
LKAWSFILPIMCENICTWVCAHAYICYIITFLSNYLSMYVSVIHGHDIIDLILIFIKCLLSKWFLQPFVKWGISILKESCIWKYI